jgi:hypothetical protein
LQVAKLCDIIILNLCKNMIKNVESKRKLWTFVTMETPKVKEKESQIEIYEEIFNLGIEVQQLKFLLQEEIDVKKKMKMTKKLKSLLERLKELKQIVD